MRERIRRFRKSAEAENAGRDRRRYSPELRREALSIFAERRLDGAGVRLVAAALGLAPVTLGRWQQKGKRAAAAVPFRPVELVGDANVASGRLRLLTPRGFALEGLDIANIMALLSAL